MDSKMYENAVCLAPMVRGGTLPLRLLSLRYGADLVYGEEIIDRKIAATTRVVNDVLNTVDYVTRNGDSVVFRTCAEESAKVVFQIGTASAVHALKAAETIARDVASVDINMGCPKHFSVQGGMGIALMGKPEVASDILKTLKRNLNIPVSCKIRIKATPQETIDFAKAMELSGAAAIGVHARQAHELPSDDAHWDALPLIPSALSIPVLANGDIWNQDDIARVRQATGCQSVLVARGALSNASCFRAAGIVPYQQNVEAYLKVAADTDNAYQNTKYNISRMLPSKDVASTVDVATIAEAKSNADMFALFGLTDYYQSVQAGFQSKAAAAALRLPVYIPDRAYDDAHIKNRAFFCDPCGVQLLSAQDVAGHEKGKRHKNKLRTMASQAMAALSGMDTTNFSTAINDKHETDDDPVPKRVKHTTAGTNDDQV
ncbi:hypothetical protein H257_10473 [Aphanomyces astaci]|uniref:C2H2-type domain-containing protein n=1 Tax=Aphanomyces astaci TaxID=112090 RepID=W4G8B6_APHAT|nr:hypothetical protein H257_10473 [Aphanomyces astaci]ETV75289.1 hypothetical protein H257_10473 [Aphanomyces astaci]|eukprot:XP_009835337.1 hypothetical protein H257_10473 [Aphanomyces astaci]